MKKANVKNITSSFKDLTNFLDGFSKSDDFHLTLDVLVQTEYKGFVNSFEFDKYFQDSTVIDRFNRLSQFINDHRKDIVSTRFKFDLIVIDK